MITKLQTPFFSSGWSVIPLHYLQAHNSMLPTATRAVVSFLPIVATRPKIFAPFDFYRSHLIIRLIQKKLRKYKNNCDILKIYTMIKHVIAK
jgi:hypothetical protein